MSLRAKLSGAVCRFLAEGFANFQLSKWGVCPRPQASKKDSCLSLLFLFFSSLEKAPPAISLRAFHAEALPCLSARTSVARLTALISLCEISLDFLKLCVFSFSITVSFILFKPNLEISTQFVEQVVMKIFINFHKICIINCRN